VIAERFEEVKSALAELVKLGWVIARVEVISDETEGSEARIVLRYEPPNEHDVL
jgi:hypothetical protein